MAEEIDPIEAIEKLSKAQAIDLILLQMFAKAISLDDITARIKEKQPEVIRVVNDVLRETVEASK